MLQRSAGLLIAAVLFLGVFSFCSSALAKVNGLPAGRDYASASQASAGPVPATGSSMEYVFGVGDRVKLTVYGENDLSGEYEVGSTGIISLPLAGDVMAAGQTARAFEQAVKQKLSQGYLRDPRVSAQVANYRPFFILGEVTKPGSYPYVNGMTVVNAIALAGGYTYRADRKGIMIKRTNDPEKKEVPIAEEETVMPGDVLRIPERFF